MYRLFIFFVLLTFLAGSALAAGRIILVGAGAPEARDVILVERLESMGFTVEPHAHDAAHPVDLSGVTLVFISETTSSGNITNKYADSTVPVINCETWTYDDMGFTAADTGHNSDPGDALRIVDRNHPITKGFSEQVQVYNTAAPIMGANNFVGDVEILATRADDETRASITVYEEGAQTLIGTTQARHVNMFVHGDGLASLTDDGWKLLENAVLYATDLATAVGPSEKLATRWAFIKTR